MSWNNQLKKLITMRLLIAISIVLFIYGCREKETISVPPTDVNAFEVQAHTIPATFEFVGVAKSSHPVEIRSRVEGYLQSICYQEGSLVQENDLLFEIDPRQFEAAVLEATGELQRQEAVLWRAKKSYERIEPLYLKNAASQRDLDNACGALMTAEASVIAAKGNLIKAELNLSYTKITSPIKGMTGKAFFQEGSLITPGPNGLLTYVSIVDPIWVYFSITGSELLQARTETKRNQLIVPGTQNYLVRLRLSDGSLFPYIGKVNFNSPILDPKTGTMSVRAEFPNPYDELLPGEFVKAIVSGAYHPNALVVPQTALLQGKDGMYVFVINNDMSLTRRKVEVGEWYKDYWVIKDGLCVGEKIVAEGVNKVSEFSKVHILALSCFPNDEATGLML